MVLLVVLPCLVSCGGVSVPRSGVTVASVGFKWGTAGVRGSAGDVKRGPVNLSASFAWFYSAAQSTTTTNAATVPTGGLVKARVHATTVHFPTRRGTQQDDDKTGTSATDGADSALASQVCVHVRARSVCCHLSHLVLSCLFRVFCCFVVCILFCACVPCRSYDPKFMLPLLNHLLGTTEVPLRMFVSCGALALAISSTSSAAPSIRRQAYVLWRSAV